MAKLRRRQEVASRAAAKSTLSGNVSGNPIYSSPICSRIDSTYSPSGARSHNRSPNHSPPSYSHAVSPRKSIKRAFTDLAECTTELFITQLQDRNELLSERLSIHLREQEIAEKRVVSKLRRSALENATLRRELATWQEKFSDRLDEYIRQSTADSLAATVPKKPCQSARQHRLDLDDRITELEYNARKATNERDLATAKYKAISGELTRLKKRNAVLAEELLQKRGLELTVDGQNRYLAELSAALDETRKVDDGSSGNDYGGSYQLSSPAPESPVFMPFQRNLELRSVSEGSNWPSNLFKRELASSDSSQFGYLRRRSGVSTCSFQPASPPLTEETDYSPRAGRSAAHQRSSLYNEFREAPAGIAENNAEIGGRRVVCTGNTHASSELHRNHASLFSEITDSSSSSGQTRLQSPVQLITPTEEVDYSDITWEGAVQDDISSPSLRILRLRSSKSEEDSLIDPQNPLSSLDVTATKVCDTMLLFSDDSTVSPLVRWLMVAFVWLRFILLLLITMRVGM